MYTLALTAVGILLVFVPELLVHIALLAALLLGNLGHLEAARREPQEVVCLELVNLVEKGVEAKKNGQ